MKRISPHTNEALAHAAGFFDGEGCVTIYVRKNHQISIEAVVANTNKQILEYFQNEFGGVIRTTEIDNPNWKTSYDWSFAGEQAIRFLSLIEPWIMIKSEQILLAKHLFEIRNRKGQRRTEEYVDTILRIRDHLNWLNRKGKRKEDDLRPIPFVTEGSVWWKERVCH